MKKYHLYIINLFQVQYLYHHIVSWVYMNGYLHTFCRSLIVDLWHHFLFTSCVYSLAFCFCMFVLCRNIQTWNIWENALLCYVLMMMVMMKTMVVMMMICILIRSHIMKHVKFRFITLSFLFYLYFDTPRKEVELSCCVWLHFLLVLPCPPPPLSDSLSQVMDTQKVRI